MRPTFGHCTAKSLVMNQVDSGVCARKIQGYVTFRKCYISLYFPYLLYVCKKNTRICNISKSKFWTCDLKSYVSLYFPAVQFILKKNTRIHNFSNLSQKSVTRNVMYPCIFLAFYMNARKIQGYITFGMITLFSSEKSGLKNTRIYNFSNLLLKLKIHVSLYIPAIQENTRIHNFSKLVILSLRFKNFEKLCILVNFWKAGKYKDT